jgi:hypothetical protein
MTQGPARVKEGAGEKKTTNMTFMHQLHVLEGEGEKELVNFGHSCRTDTFVK